MWRCAGESHRHTSTPLLHTSAPSPHPRDPGCSPPTRPYRADVNGYRDPWTDGSPPPTMPDGSFTAIGIFQQQSHS
ncbi:hypothetical protein BN381_130056 [Candidatus Microthrix parvicella RN1]|uniref:Uncharacterized protein n=1 Tax=Candidatus Neomicrothrix parvicella RN1 TaxID=1229780 RepID=R4YWS1_9ACTN|nr:hypothetical protein BN381_130056 [Candidatus Microthrix parvicella RN1]